MDDVQIGAALHKLRFRKRWRQKDLANEAGVSRWTVARAERGRFDEVTLQTLRRIVEALDANLSLALRWQGGELDRLLNSKHSAMHEAVARLFAEINGWEIVPEVSFSIYGERGVIDLIAWHPASRMLMIVELKTEIVEVQLLMGSVDRKRRLAWKIARDRGWEPAHVSVWVLLAESRTNRRQLAAHSTVLRAAFPQDGRTIGSWLRAPTNAVAALSFLPKERHTHRRSSLAAQKRARRPNTRGAATRADHGTTRTTSEKALMQSSKRPPPPQTRP